MLSSALALLVSSALALLGSSTLTLLLSSELLSHQFVSFAFIAALIFVISVRSLALTIGSLYFEYRAGSDSRE